MRIQLSDHFNYSKLLRYAFPSIITMVFTSIYSVVDGFFISNYVGKTPFSAVNFIMPFLMILGSVGFMFGTGGSALIAQAMGEGKPDKANRLFSLIVYSSVVCGIIMAVLGFIFIRPLASALGASGQLLEDSITYGRILLLSVPMFILQYEFQCFFATAEKPALGLYVTIAAGCTNIVLDALLVAVLSLGLRGAAAATFISQCVGGIFPLFYFVRQNTSLLRLGRTAFDKSALAKTCFNGFSELLSNIATSIVSMLYNVQLLKYMGEDGIAAYGVLMYVSFIFQAIFIGYSVGTAPITGYHYGANNQKELKNLLKRNLFLIGIFAVVMFVSAYALAKPLGLIFVSYDKDLLSMTVHAFSVYSFSFLFSGFAIYGSSFFTALGNGLTSALISFLRTLVFQTAAVLTLPVLFGSEGIWVSGVAAEGMAFIVTALFLYFQSPFSDPG